MICKIVPSHGSLNNLCERFVNELENNKAVPFIIFSSALALTAIVMAKWRWQAEIKPAPTPRIPIPAPTPPTAYAPISVETPAPDSPKARKATGIDAEADSLLGILNGVLEEHPNEPLPAAVPSSLPPAPAVVKKSIPIPPPVKEIEETTVVVLSAEEARESYKEKAGKGDAKAMVQYAKMCREGKGGPVDFVEERRWLTNASYYLKEDDPELALVCLRLGNMWEEGTGGESVINQAAHFYQKAAWKGNPDALFWIAYKRLPIFKDEPDYDRNTAWAVQDFLRAAELGHIPARLIYLELNLQKKCEDLDRALRFFDEAFNVLLKDADLFKTHQEQIMRLLKSMPYSHREIALAYLVKLVSSMELLGKEVALPAQIIYAEILPWDQKSLAAEGFEKIGQAYNDDSHSCKRAFHEAAKLYPVLDKKFSCFKAAAEGKCGIPEAMYELALCYRDSKGCKEDNAEAKKWFKLAADYKSEWNDKLRGEAAYNYALMCHEGKGGKKDKKEAEYYIHRAKAAGKYNAELPSRWRKK